MNPNSSILALVVFGFASLAPAGQGPAGASGACSHVMGPIGNDGAPVGFSCTDVGGNALLVWNAAQLSSDISVSGNIKTVNFYPGNFSIDGNFTSDGALAFIGGGITVNGSVTAASVLLAGVSSTEGEIGTTLLSPAGRIVGTATSRVNISPSGKITATTGNAIIAGKFVANSGQISAQQGTVTVKTGTKLDIGWSDIVWLEGAYNGFSATDYRIRNNGSITATNIVLEAHRVANVTTIANNGKLSATDSITFVTGLPAVARGDGTFAPSSFGITNSGNICAAKITLSPFYPATPGGQPTDRTFITKNAAQLQDIRLYLGGRVGTVLGNTPAGATAVVNDTTSTAGTAAPAAIVIPQLAVSLTHMNSTSSANAPIALAKTTSTETVRGSTTKPASAAKPRVKAKPVLVRGAFFNTKISATIAASH